MKTLFQHRQNDRKQLKNFLICFKRRVRKAFEDSVSFDNCLTNVDSKYYRLRARGFVQKAQSVATVILLNDKNMWNRMDPERFWKRIFLNIVVRRIQDVFLENACNAFTIWKGSIFFKANFLTSSLDHSESLVGPQLTTWCLSCLKWVVYLLVSVHNEPTPSHIWFWLQARKRLLEVFEAARALGLQTYENLVSISPLFTYL